jgi:hypothetical protein
MKERKKENGERKVRSGGRGKKISTLPTFILE